MLLRSSYRWRPSARPKKRRVYRESSLQATVIQLLRFQARRGVMWVAVPNEGKRTAAETARLLKNGMKPGAGDLQLTIDRLTHWLEFKDGNRPQSEAQEDFQAECEMNGIPYAVVRSFNEAEAQLHEWGAFREARSEQRRAA